MSSGVNDGAEEVIEQEENPLHQQFRQRGRVHTPPKKAWLYDCEDKTLTVRNREELERSDEVFDKIKLKKNKKKIALFVDPGSESISTSQSNKEGYCNVPLALLLLNQSGVWNNILRLLGQIPTLYVTKSGLSSKGQSQRAIA